MSDSIDQRIALIDKALDEAAKLLEHIRETDDVAPRLAFERHGEHIYASATRLEADAE